MEKTKKIVFAALLLALFIILDRFPSFKIPVLKIGLGFVPLVLAAMVLGPKYSFMIGLFGDLIGAIFWPFGQYFWGYTFSAGLSGLIYGLFLYENQKGKFSNKMFILRMVLSCIIVKFIINLGINTYWISITGGKAFMVLLPARITTETISFFVHLPIIYILKQFIDRSQYFDRTNERSVSI